MPRTDSDIDPASDDPGGAGEPEAGALAVPAGAHGFGAVRPVPAAVAHPPVPPLGEDGGAQEILDAIRKYAAIIKERQKALNGLSEQWGNAVHWWDAGMHPSFLFIDEYVALRSLLPKKADKAAPDYSLAEFDDLIKRIVTMGASAGCYVIISIAQASVDEGGLPPCSGPL